MVTIILYTRQQKRHWCIDQSFGLCGKGRGWDDLGEWHWNTYNIIYGMSRQSRFDARYWMLGAGALGWPRGMVWVGRREEGSGWGTHVYLWQIHFDVWQNQYNIVKFKNKIQLKKKKTISRSIHVTADGISFSFSWLSNIPLYHTEWSQRKINIMILPIYRIQKKLYKWTYLKNINTHRGRKQTYITKGERGGRINWEIGIDIYTLLLLLLLSCFSRVWLSATP